MVNKDCRKGKRKAVAKPTAFLYSEGITNSIFILS